MSGSSEGVFEVEYEAANDIVRLEYLGRMTCELILAAADATFTVPHVTDRTSVLAVYLHADIDEIDLDALIAYQEHKIARGYPNLPAAAVLADRPSHLAMGELWAATKPGGKDSGARVFTDEAAARAWLLSWR